MAIDPERKTNQNGKKEEGDESLNPRFSDAEGEKEVVVRYPMDVEISVEVHPVSEK